ncbi:Metalloprotease TIKI2 [Portunus trituberculatus]|uniref:Metalloprotease TIKI homolog n=1 Tax=Portunus trituberculatus TaxID=210409 RepID=A0A5B7HSN8_PORTR|nr:Metalloprotease TIKI2 [Portunus trituberculatus]
MLRRVVKGESEAEACVSVVYRVAGRVVFALNHTLAQQEILREGDGRLTYTTDHLITHYNCGNLDAVIFSQDTTQLEFVVKLTKDF